MPVALKLGRTCPDVDCKAIFERCEWQDGYLVAHRCASPDEPPPLGEMVILIATLGGYLDCKYDGPPAPEILWIGIRRVREFTIAMKFQENGERRYV